MRTDATFEPRSLVDSLECPISFETIIDPITTTTGQTYEATAINKWLETNSTDPFNPESKLSHELLVKNQRLSEICKLIAEEKPVPIELFCCGITRTILTDPIILPHGHKFEGTTCQRPATPNYEAIPNRALKEIIEKIVLKEMFNFYKNYLNNANESPKKQLGYLVKHAITRLLPIKLRFNYLITSIYSLESNAIKGLSSELLTYLVNYGYNLYLDTNSIEQIIEFAATCPSYPALLFLGKLYPNVLDDLVSKLKTQIKISGELELDLFLDFLNELWTNTTKSSFRKIFCHIIHHTSLRETVSQNTVAFTKRVIHFHKRGNFIATILLNYMVMANIYIDCQLLKLIYEIGGVKLLTPLHIEDILQRALKKEDFKSLELHLTIEDVAAVNMETLITKTLQKSLGQHPKLVTQDNIAIYLGIFVRHKKSALIIWLLENYHKFEIDYPSIPFNLANQIEMIFQGTMLEYKIKTLLLEIFNKAIATNRKVPQLITHPKEMPLNTSTADLAHQRAQIARKRAAENKNDPVNNMHLTEHLENEKPNAMTDDAGKEYKEVVAIDSDADPDCEVIPNSFRFYQQKNKRQKVDKQDKTKQLHHL